MKIRFLISITCMALFVGACGGSTSFMIGEKGSEMRGHFLGSSSNSLYELLCVSGGLSKVLEDTQFSKEMKEQFYQYNCSAERSGDKVRQLYASMTSDQRKDIRTAFKKNGFAINGGSC